MLSPVLRTFFVLGLVAILSTAAAKAADGRPDELVRMILKLIADEDREFRAAGLEQVRTGAPGPETTRLFAGRLKSLAPDGQMALLNALADRGDGAAHSAIVDLIASSHDENVRSAALGALGRLGTADDLALILDKAAGGSNRERAAGIRSLVEMRGPSMNQALAAKMQAASPEVQAALIDVLAARRADDQIPAYLAASVSENSQVRQAAMTALGELGRPEHIPRMVPGVLKARKGFERDRAEARVAAVCARIPNEEERSAALIAALNAVDPARRDELMSLAGRVGGRKLIDFVAAIAAGPDAPRRRIAIDALSKWPDAGAADQLLAIANKADNEAEREQAFQAYVKVSAARDQRSDQERLARLKQAMSAARTQQDIALVINRVRTAYDVESMRFVLPYVDKPAFSQIACETIVEIAHHREVRDPHKAEFDKALDKVIAISKDPVVVERAGRYKRGETWDRRSRSRR